MALKELYSVPPQKIPEALRYLESSLGRDPNTPPDTIRKYTIPPFNKNEQSRVEKYQTGYAGEYGLTPVALAQLAKSVPDLENKAAYTRFGPSTKPSPWTPEKIQSALKTREGAGMVARIFFSQQRGAPAVGYSPEQLANDYMEHYVTSGSPFYTEDNRKRALAYFKSIAQKNGE